ncbi:hypothetical protein [Haloarcula sediminis]|uniref:hypothetical protein n=1 Tax=Haloarcula sediminis TaxID=3111777 RepID=UPI002D769779|nr:hypothetical protein [Haloarcula sp. CK38]
MADPALQRTVTRGIALVVLPLSALVMGAARWSWSDTYGASPPTAFGELAFEIVPTLLFVGALVYLAISGVFGLLDRAAADTEG